MMTTAQVFLVGRIGTAIERHDGDHPRATFRLAVDSFVRKGERVTSWYNVTAFGGTADLLGRHAAKGAGVWVVGPIRLRDYTDRDGHTRTSADVVANQVGVVTDRNADSAQPRATWEDPEAGPGDMPF